MKYIDEITGLEIDSDTIQYPPEAGWGYLNQHNQACCWFESKSEALRWYMQSGRPENMKLVQI